MSVLYRVEKADSEELGFPVELDEALEQVARRVQRENEGSLRITKVRYRLDPEEPPSTESRPMKQLWRGTVLKFPDIGSAGVFVCKPLQHGRGGGNAGDWTAPVGSNTEEIINYLRRVFLWQREQGILFEDSDGKQGLPISEVIFRDQIATRARNWNIRPYTGTFHASHVHSSAFPLLGPGPCG